MNALAFALTMALCCGLTPLQRESLEQRVPDAVCREYVRTSRGSIETSAPLFEAVYQVYRAWSHETSPFTYIPPGIVGSLGDTRRSDELFRTPVTVNLRDVTLESALDEVVHKAAGVGWVLKRALSEQHGVGCELALFTSESTLTTGWRFYPQER